MKGRQIFNNYCAACHKLSARATGTALRGVDSTVYSNWMKVEKREFDTIRFKELGVEYHRYLASELNTLEIRNIYQYTKPISN
ncbi:MAG: c-type cytochrome [Flavobacterium sp.]|uniref:c-type cytochrome n=1 Tax=Flavobacterium sp. TaxID=239 RepID=UPI001207FF1F|nr:c-type cytochrome [Flavobacterium sp.]RZJ67841.1 MAG: c-type cytochrome [Flavobacterium sp.]